MAVGTYTKSIVVTVEINTHSDNTKVIVYCTPATFSSDLKVNIRKQEIAQNSTYNMYAKTFIFGMQLPQGKLPNSIVYGAPVTLTFDLKVIIQKIWIQLINPEIFMP